MATFDDALQLVGQLLDELNGISADLDFHVGSRLSRAIDTAEQTQAHIEEAIAIDDRLHPEER